jgi:hypothetical protein
MYTIDIHKSKLIHTQIQFHIKLIRTESKSIIADQDRVILKLYSTKYIKHNKTNCLHASTTMA